MVNYKLDGKKIVPCESILEWAMAFESKDQHVADERVWGLRVSTVFLGIDHNFRFNGSEPVLFETMVFVGRTGHDIEMRRYCTWDEAEAGHKEVVVNIKRHLWNCVVLPWAEYGIYRLRSKVFKLLNRILVWVWPAIYKLRLAVHKMTDRIKVWRQ